MILPFCNKLARFCVISSFIIAFSLCAAAYPGELDTTFNNTGFASLSGGLGNDGANAVAVQKDGKIVAAGFAVNGYQTVQFGDEDFALVRYNADGSLDSSFGEGGKVFYHIKASKERANAVTVQPDGKIIAAGVSKLNNFDSFALIRFNSDGSLDTSFGNQGVVITQIGYSQSSIYALALQADGKIVTTGLAEFGFTLVRFNADGKRDQSFVNNGVVSLSPAIYSYSRTLVIQPDGKIVVGGGATNRSYSDFAVTRFNENGTLDKRFGFMGRAIIPITASTDGVYALALQADGKIIAAGHSFDGNNYPKYTVARLTSGGRLDTSFGEGGKVVTPLSNNQDIIYGVAVQPDGAIVAAGTSNDGNQYRIGIVRYRPDGSLDPSFGDGGKVVTPFQNSVTANALVLQADGKILTAGLTSTQWSGDFAVFRYNTDGSLDNSYDTDGKSVTDIGTPGGEWRSVLVQEDSKIIAVGYGFDETGQKVALFRYNADGSPDAGFGTSGRVMTGIGSNGSGLDAVLQPDGKILVCSYVVGGYAVIRYNADGSLDGSFGTNGIKAVSFGHAGGSVAAIDIQSDGKIILTGSAMRTSNSERIFATLRLNANDGSLDTSFGENGIAWTAIATYNLANAVVVQSDDKIIVAGLSFGTSIDFALVRYNADGTLDNTFGFSGVVTTPVGEWWDEVNALFVQPDGKILAAGIVKNDSNSPTSHFTLVRYLANGALDTSFNRSGKVITPIDAESWASSVVMQKDGKIIVGGKSASSAAAFHEFTLARFNANGTLDATFGGKSNLPGTRVVDFGNGADIINAIALQPDGRIVGAGMIKSRPGVARFLSE